MSDPRPRTESELVELVRASDARAPDALHEDVRALIAGRGRTLEGRRRSPLARRFAAATAIVAVAAALALLLSGGSRHSTLTLSGASALTLRPAAAAAPRESASNHAQLAAAVEGVAFPYWKERFGWRATGARSDRVQGRTATTVFYADGRGRRIGYAIVGGTPPRLGGGVQAWRGGVPYRLSVANGAPVVTWLRHGRLCVVSGHGVDGATLLRLASWGERAAPTRS
jgi:hypothetical protein